MNKRELGKSVGSRVSLRPIARRFEGEQELPLIDDVWDIQRVISDGIQIKNTRTCHCLILGFDQIYTYMSDTIRSSPGEVHGMLRLHVQLILRGDGVLVEPCPRPGEAYSGPIVFRR